MTHIIVGCNEKGLCPRTVKYLRGIIDGKFVVSYDWFLASLSAGRYVAEEPYLIRGDEVIDRPTNAVQRSLEAHRGDPLHRLFTNVTVFLAGSFSPPAPSRKDLSEMIVGGGGKVITRKPSAHDPSVIIICDSPQELAKYDTFPNHLTTHLLLDAISQYLPLSSII